MTEKINLNNIEQLAELDTQIFDEVVSNTIKQLIANKQSITAAESLTAGMFLAAVASVPGASAILSGGFVTYANSAKIKLLDIASTLIDQFGVVSAETATAMAQNSRAKMQSAIGIGLTGVAGPDSLEQQTAGTVYIGISINDENDARKFNFVGNRELIRKKAVLTAMLMIQERIN